MGNAAVPVKRLTGTMIEAPPSIRRRWLVACGVGLAWLPARPALADGIPSPANSTVPCAISVVPAPAVSSFGEF
jgi:hypothetical protein